ncbi:MAG: oligosaccharide flippase family protein [bacterium]
MISRVRNVFIISSFGVLGGFIKNILLARELSKDELGLFSLLMAVVGFVYPLTLLGQQNAIVRFMANKEFSKYNWPKQFWRVLILSLVLTCGAVAIFTPIYNLGILAIIFLLFTTFSSGGTDLLAAIFRAQRKYELSMFTFRLLSLFLPVVVFLLLITKLFTFKNILIFFAVFYLLSPIIMIGVTRKKLLVGTEEIPKLVWKDGLFFWGSDLSLLIIFSVDRFFIPKLLSYEALGEYFAIYSIMRLFDLVLKSLEFVMMPHVKKSPKIRLGWLLGWSLSIGLILSTAYLVFGNLLVSVLFKGKYDSTTFLIPFFCILGVIRLLHVIPYSVIGGLLNQERLRQMFYVNIITVVLCVVLSFILIKSFGLLGAVISSIIIWILKTVAGFGIMFFEKIFVKQNNLQVEGVHIDV